MSDNIQYKAIQNFYDQLVKAIIPEIEALLKKAWSKNIIGAQQLDVSLEPTANSSRKAKAFVSAIAARVNCDRTVFGKFLSLLREIKSLEYIAKLLESQVIALGPAMSGSQSALSGASSGNSPNSGNRANPARLLDEMPKLDLAEDLTIESGFDESGREQLGAIAGEEATDKENTSGSNDTIVHVPESNRDYLKAFRKVEGGDSAQGGVVGVGIANEDDFNLAVISQGEDVSPISEAVGREGDDEQQELVVPSGQQVAAGGSPDRDTDVTESAVGDILRDNKRKNTEICKLKDELTRLHVEVESLNKENLKLKHKLESKEQETELSKQKYEQEIENLESKLHEKEAAVKKIRLQLAETEKRIDLPKQELHKKIKQLEKEREELQSTVSKLNDDHKKQAEQNRLQLLELREELNRKQTELIEKQAALNKAQAEENKHYKRMCTLEVELEREKAKNYESRVKEVELEKQILKDEKNQLEKSHTVEQVTLKELQEEKKKAQETLTKERAASNAAIQELVSKIVQLTCSSQSLPADISKDRSDEDPLSEIQKQSSQTESCESSITYQNPPIDHQSSQTESTGQPSRSGSTATELLLSTTASEPGVRFKIGLGNESDRTPDLESKSQENA